MKFDDLDYDYEDLREHLEQLPMTWYPDLIRAMVEASIKKNVWQKGGVSTFVKSVEKKAGYSTQPDSSVGGKDG